MVSPGYAELGGPLLIRHSITRTVVTPHSANLSPLLVYKVLGELLLLLLLLLLQPWRE